MKSVPPSCTNACLQNLLMVVFTLAGIFILVQHTIKTRNMVAHLTGNVSIETSLLHVLPSAKLKAVGRKNQVKARHIPTTKATKMRFGPMYLFGASAGNTTNKMAWDVIQVYASCNLTFFKNPNITCCLMYKSKNKTDIVQQPVSQLKYHPFKANLTTIVVTCPNVRHLYEDVPSKVGLSLAEFTCGETSVNYIEPFVPYKKSGVKIALGTQVAFGNLSAELIIEWMEAYKYLGVDKVISYYYKGVNMKAFKVLQYYHNSGFVDLYKYIPAGEGNLPRDFREADYQLFNDLTVVVKESLERMSGYTYFGIIDFDEFLIPAKNWTFQEMLYHLNKAYRNAAGFVFKTQFYHTSWGKSGRVNDLILGQYVNRTSIPPKMERPKQIYNPERVIHGSVFTHNFSPVKGFQRIIVPQSMGFIRHFRKCRQEREAACLKSIDRVTDASLAEWSMRIKDRVHQVRRKVFGKRKI